MDKITYELMITGAIYALIIKRICRIRRSGKVVIMKLPAYTKWLIFGAIAFVLGGIFIFFLARHPSSHTPQSPQVSEPSYQTSADENTAAEKKTLSSPQASETDEHTQHFYLAVNSVVRPSYGKL